MSAVLVTPHDDVIGPRSPVVSPGDRFQVVSVYAIGLCLNHEAACHSATGRLRTCVERAHAGRRVTEKQRYSQSASGRRHAMGHPSPVMLVSATTLPRPSSTY